MMKFGYNCCMAAVHDILLPKRFFLFLRHFLFTSSKNLVHSSTALRSQLVPSDVLILISPAAKNVVTTATETFETGVDTVPDVDDGKHAHLHCVRPSCHVGHLNSIPTPPRRKKSMAGPENARICHVFQNHPGDIATDASRSPYHNAPTSIAHPPEHTQEPRWRVHKILVARLDQPELTPFPPARNLRLCTVK